MKKFIYVLAAVMIVVVIIQQITIHNLKDSNSELENNVSQLDSNLVRFKRIYEEMSNDYGDCLVAVEQNALYLKAVRERLEKIQY